MGSEIPQLAKSYLGENVFQYLIVIGAFAALLAIKAYAVKKKYDQDLDQYVEP